LTPIKAKCKDLNEDLLSQGKGIRLDSRGISIKKALIYFRVDLQHFLINAKMLKTKIVEKKLFYFLKELNAQCSGIVE
jgi:hypothetical protein